MYLRPNNFQLKDQVPRRHGADFSVDGEALGTATKLPATFKEIRDLKTGEIAVLGELTANERIIQTWMILFSLQYVA